MVSLQDHQSDDENKEGAKVMNDITAHFIQVDGSVQQNEARKNNEAFYIWQQ